MSRLTNKKLVDLKYGEFLSISKEEYRKQVHEAPTYKEIYTKLGKLEDLEDELGCPLEVVFKALKEGIWFKSDDFITKNLEKDLATRPRLYYSDDFKCYRFEIGFGLHYVALKDYQKTWWLRKNGED